MLEYFDFYCVVFASTLAWPQVFFSGVSPALGTALSLLSLGIFYLSNPLGAFIFGHFGDKIGRKTVLVWTLLLMGLGTLAIAVLPGYDAIGVWAPITLVVIRIVQGIGFGGEFGGASTWISECAAESNRRGFWTGWMQVAAYIAAFGASSSFNIVLALSTHQAFLDYGWRIIFGVGALVGVVGLMLRAKLSDSAIFEALKRTKSTEREPASKAIRNHPMTIVALALIAASTLYASTLQPFIILYLGASKVDPVFISTIAAYSSGVTIIAALLGANISDVIGRRWAARVSTITSTLLVFPLFLLLKTLNPVFMILSTMIMYGASGFGFGVLAAMFPEQFPAKYRYSGTGLAFSLGRVVVGLQVTIVFPTLIGISGGPLLAWPLVVAAYALINAGGLISTFLIKETRQAVL